MLQSKQVCDTAKWRQFRREATAGFLLMQGHPNDSSWTTIPVTAAGVRPIAFVANGTTVVVVRVRLFDRCERRKGIAAFDHSALA